MRTVLLMLVVAGIAQQAAMPVSVSVTVSHRNGDAPVTGLTAADFRVFEDGREQVVTSATVEPAAMSIAIVVDSSDSMAGFRQQLAQQVVEQLVASLTADDEVAVLSYDGRITVPVPWTRPKEFPRLEWARWKTMPSNEVLQGIYQAFGLVNAAANPRTVILAISDAEQVASPYRLSQFVKNRRESETAIYGVRTADLLSGRAAIGGPRPGPDGTTLWESRGELISFDDLVRDSGGVVVPARTTAEVGRAVQRLVGDLRHQYVVRFTSSKPPDGKYRKLKVELRKGAHKLRYRGGYLARVD